MFQWQIVVTEDGFKEDYDVYVYSFDTWEEVVKRLAAWDGLAIEYSISHNNKKEV